MYIRDLVRRSGRSLKSAKARTILTALAIAVGGFTLALTIAAGNGAKEYASKLISSNFDPAELIVARDKEITNSGTPSDKPQEYDESITSLNVGGPNGQLQVKRVSQADVDELRKNPKIEQVRESYQISIRYITRPDMKKYTGGSEVYNPAQKPELKSGSTPESGDILAGNVLIPDSYLEPLGFASPEDAIGKTVTVAVQRPFSIEAVQTILTDTKNLESLAAENFKAEEKTVDFVVAGVTKKPATSLSFGISPILLSNTDARQLYEYTTKGTTDNQQYLYVFARVKDGENSENLQVVKTELEGQGYYTQSIKDIQKTITQFINILQTIVLVFGVITLIASVFGIVNTQYISVLERTREIGMMKALGMSKKNISRLFLLEAVWIGFLGAVIGITAGLALGISLNPWIAEKLDLGPGNYLLIFQPAQLLALLFVLMLIAALAGLAPARKAAKLDPVEALRTE